jgi:hypothetical protein
MFATYVFATYSRLVITRTSNSGRRGKWHEPTADPMHVALGISGADIGRRPVARAQVSHTSARERLVLTAVPVSGPTLRGSSQTTRRSVRGDAHANMTSRDRVPTTTTAHADFVPASARNMTRRAGRTRGAARDGTKAAPATGAGAVVCQCGDEQRRSVRARARTATARRARQLCANPHRRQNGPPVRRRSERRERRGRRPPAWCAQKVHRNGRSGGGRRRRASSRVRKVQCSPLGPRRDRDPATTARRRRDCAPSIRFGMLPEAPSVAVRAQQQLRTVERKAKGGGTGPAMLVAALTPR